MAGRRAMIDRAIPILGLAVLALGAAIVFLIARDGFRPRVVTPEKRAAAQVRELVGRGAVVIYSERGRREAVCGYVKSGGGVTAFVARPNRLMLETDPLPTEFRQNLRDLCPGFARAPQPAAAP